MLEGILPEQIFKPLAHKIGFSRINEIRIRADKHILISSLGQKFFLSELGACKELNRAIFADKSMIEEIIGNVTERSLYAFNEEIKKGYFSPFQLVIIRSNAIL